MFLNGFLQMYVGCVMSGKTTKLVATANRLRLQKRPFLWLNAKKEKNGLYIEEAEKIFDLSKDNNIVLIDNAHLFTPTSVEIISMLKQHKIIHLAGRDTNSFGLAYPTIGALMCHADKVDKLTAVCKVCGSDAKYTTVTQRKTKLTPEKCEPRCFTHWNRRKI